jgi:branched-subunit amino acid aminotransferase/4-amino-4-deoxychorismate lyase
LNGRFIPAAELTIPAYDAGFVLGATVSEQLRTFGGKLFKLDEHLARLRRGLEITSIDAGCTDEQLATWANELAAANHKLLDPADDLGLSIFVTPGPYATLAPADVERRVIFSPTTEPMEPPMNSNTKKPASTGMPPIAAVPARYASPGPTFRMLLLS